MLLIFFLSCVKLIPKIPTLKPIHIVKLFVDAQLEVNFVSKILESQHSLVRCFNIYFTDFLQKFHIVSNIHL